MNVWRYQQAVSRRLLWWSGLSIAVGAALLLGRELLQGMGIQAIAWGGIDALIAIAGRLLMRRRQVALPAPLALDVLAREARNLRRLLLINTGLDVLYVTGGVILALTLGSGNLFWRGTGWGIVVQGGFLFAFDLSHALGVPTGP